MSEQQDQIALDDVDSIECDELASTLWYVGALYERLPSRVRARGSEGPSGSCCVGTWDPDLGMCTMESEKGKKINSLGITHKSRRALYPEETMWLLQENKLALRRPGDGKKESFVSLTEGFVELLAASNVPMEWFIVYTFMKNKSFVIRRSAGGRSSPLRFTDFGISLDGCLRPSSDEIRLASFEIWEPTTRFARKKNTTPPRWICFVCLYVNRAIGLSLQTMFRLNSFASSSFSCPRKVSNTGHQRPPTWQNYGRFVHQLRFVWQWLIKTVS